MNGDRFTQRVQLWWIFILGMMFIGIGQAFNFSIYQISIVVMILVGLSQIAVGNVPPDAPRRRFFRFLGIFAVVIVIMFAISIVSIPYLVNLGR
ncbi:MAG: hypothetical protein ABFR95_02070 [Actinomycetota bacterium]